MRFRQTLFISPTKQGAQSEHDESVSESLREMRFLIVHRISGFIGFSVNSYAAIPAPIQTHRLLAKLIIKIRKCNTLFKSPSDLFPGRTAVSHFFLHRSRGRPLPSLPRDFSAENGKRRENFPHGNFSRFRTKPPTRYLTTISPSHAPADGFLFSECRWSARRSTFARRSYLFDAFSGRIIICTERLTEIRDAGTPCPSVLVLVFSFLHRTTNWLSASIFHRKNHPWSFPAQASSTL